MSAIPHSRFRSILAGETIQKVLKIYTAAQPHEIFITLFPNNPGEANGQANSTAEPSGWAVNVAYKVSPESVIFNGSYPSQDQAKKIFDDLVNAAATVEGLIRGEKFEEAAKQTKIFLEKCGANSSERPVEEKP